MNDKVIETKDPGVLNRTTFSTAVEGSIVILQLGNVPIRMDYNTALQMSQFLRVAGRKAKQNAGDFSRDINIVANLTDANVDEAAAQAIRDATAAYGRKLDG